MYSAYTSADLMSLFYYFATIYFFHLSHMILEVELTRNIDIKNDCLTMDKSILILKGEVYPKIKISPVVVFGVLSRVVLVRRS